VGSLGDNTQVLYFLIELPYLSLFLVLRQSYSRIEIVRDFERSLDILFLGGDGGVLV
jgi:hypothetical protein